MDESAEAKHAKPARTFRDFEFDDRLLRVIAEMGWERPTPVQAAMIPQALDGKNVLARARTGSGKTAAFMLPLVQKVLQITANKSSAQGPFALIVAPTKELAAQLFALLEQLTAQFPFIQCFNLAQFADSHDQALAKEVLDILVSTPGRIVAACKKVPHLLAECRTIVLDEADLLFSFGYRDELKKLKSLLPVRFQCVMTSATLEEDLSELKRTFVTGKVVSLRLKEGDLPGMDQLQQFHIGCQNDEERYTILLALVKLRLLLGKSVIFVSNVDRCYKLHLFLESFKVPSCLLNAQMPANSRCRVIHEFNQGKWPYVIASECNDIFDEQNDEEEEEKQQKEKQKDEKGEKEEEEGETEEGSRRKKKLKKEKRRREQQKRMAQANGRRGRNIDKESGIGRGIDFHSVSNVINFDFPLSTDMYVHRVGRTARGFNKGTAISFASEAEQPLFEHIREEINERMGQPVIQPYEVRMKDFEGFQLRARDVLAACTKTVIRETRMAEIREELLKSRRLDAYFAKNPREREALEQDRKHFKLNVHSAGIANVPDYLVPKQLRGQNFNIPFPSSSAAAGGRRKRRHNNGCEMGGQEKETSEGGGEQKRHKKKHKFEKNAARRKHAQKMADPLQSFKF